MKYRAGRSNYREKNRKRSWSSAAAAVVFSVAFAAGGHIFSLPIKAEESPAFTVGARNYSAAAVDYYYYSAYHGITESMSGYESFLGFDPSRDPEEQDCPLSESAQNWREYILSQAETELAGISAVYQAAEASGYEADQIVQENVKYALEYHKKAASEAGYESLEEYLISEFGGSLQEKTLKELLTQSFVAYAYEEKQREEIEFTEKELQRYHDAHIWEYTNYSYLYAYVMGDEEDCKAIAAVKSEEEFREKTKEITGADCYELLEISGAELGDSTADDMVWLADPDRKAGDIYTGKSKEAWYVLYYLGKSDGEDPDTWKTEVARDMAEEQIAQWKIDLMEQYPVKEGPDIDKVGR